MVVLPVNALNGPSLRRTVTKKGRKAVEVVYLITSDRDAEPATLAPWVRSHWEIENRLHWVRDVTYLEDKSLVRLCRVPAWLAALALCPSGLCLQLRDAVTEPADHIAMVLRPSGEHIDHAVPGLDLIFHGFE
jgi:hypothetical protein